MDKKILLREYHAEDCAEIMQLFYDTIHSVNAAYYNESQLDAWAPKEIDITCWDSRFLQDHAVVAEKDNIIVGIGTLKSTGYFDLLYIHKDYQRIGVATLIADEIEGHFRDSGITTVTTDASITAKPFFENRGYVVLKNSQLKPEVNFLQISKCKRYFKKTNYNYGGGLQETSTSFFAVYAAVCKRVRYSVGARLPSRS